MDFLIKAAQLILSLSLLVILHEFGHYIPAKLFKTRVEKFYLFFNPWFSLFKTKIGDTEWGIGWLPLGGFVKISGMVDESMDKEQLAQPAQPWEFRSKPAWQRLIIMLGGVTVNIITAVIIYAGITFYYGEEQLKPQELSNGVAIHPYLESFGLVSGDNILALDDENVDKAMDLNKEIMLRGKRKLDVLHANGTSETVILPEDIDYKIFENGAYPAFELRAKRVTIDSILPGKVAEASKMKVGDQFIKIGETDINYYDDIKRGLFQGRAKLTDISLLRGKDTINLKVNVPKEGLLGFIVQQKATDYADFSKIKTAHFGLGESFIKGFKTGKNTLSDYAAQFKFVFTKKGATEVSGFAGIGNLFPSTWNWHIFWINTAFISIALAFINIMPIPALDGGHVVFLLYEIITGKEAPQKVLEYAQYVGFFLLIGLTLYVNGLDIFKWLSGS
jgi:regulator of sigma E protease